MPKSYTRLPVLALITGCSLGAVETGPGGSHTDGPLDRSSQAAASCVTPRSKLAVGSSTTLCPGGKERMRRLMSVIKAKRLPFRDLVTHTFPLDRIEEAYELFANQRDGVMKVAIRP